MQAMRNMNRTLWYGQENVQHLKYCRTFEFWNEKVMQLHVSQLLDSWHLNIVHQ